MSIVETWLEPHPQLENEEIVAGVKAIPKDRWALVSQCPFLSFFLQLITVFTLEMRIL
jgi:hypothetical protein